MATKMRRTVRVKRVVNDYPVLLAGIKERIRAAQVRATLAANAELIQLYWEVGRMIAEQQQKRGWGKAVIPRLANDLRSEIPGVKGFSERNLGYMVRFFQEYRGQSILQQPAAKLIETNASSVPRPILQQAAAKLDSIEPLTIVQQFAAQIPWFHHVLLMEKVKDLKTRVWYMRQTVENGWSRNVLALQISGQAHKRHGGAITNFDRLMPPEQSDLAKQILKDPYIFDFLTLEEPFHERELEAQLLAHVQKFLLELGQGFAFVGRQFRLEVDGEQFSIDLLFYHLRLRCFLVVDLKTGKFEAEHAGKMNFYCNVIDDQLRQRSDGPTVGLILCREKNRTVAEYALKGMDKAIGVSGYELTRSLPRQLQSSLPSIQQIEAELSRPVLDARAREKSKGIKPRRSSRGRRR